MGEVAAHGIRLELPPGWDGVIYRRPAGPGEITGAVAHVASRSLPGSEGDVAGVSAVERLGPYDVFLSLFEHAGADPGAALFGHRPLPRALAAGDLDPAALARRLPGQAGAQRFGVAAGRPFGLFVAVGSYRLRHRVLPAINRVLGSLEVRPA